MRPSSTLRGTVARTSHLRQPEVKLYRAPRPKRPEQNPASPRSATSSGTWWKVTFGLGAFAAAGFLSYRASGTRSVSPKSSSSVAEDVSDRYHGIAKDFDREVGTQERLMLLGWLRSWLVRQASGHVLEVGVGTGRNSQFYDLKKCASITMLDQATEMIDIAREKFKGSCHTQRSIKVRR